MDYVRIGRQEKDMLIDVNVSARGFSDHHLVIVKVRVGCGSVERIPTGSGKETVRVINSIKRIA